MILPSIHSFLHSCMLHTHSGWLTGWLAIHKEMADMRSLILGFFSFHIHIFYIYVYEFIIKLTSILFIILFNFILHNT